MSGTTQLTYSGVGLAVFAQQLCLPVPAVLLLVTVGALAADGRGNLDVSLVLLASVAGCVAADSFWFWLGRRWGSSVIRLVCSLTSDPRRSRESAGRIFARWGLRLLLVAKFVPGLDGVSPPLAGAEGAKISGFLVYDAAGSLLWTAVYMLLGYGFSGQLDRVTYLIHRFGTLLALGVGLPLLVYVVWRGLFLARVILHLRLRRISPALLQEKMDTSDKVAVFDLLDYEARVGQVAGIPGSLRVDPTRMRNSPQFAVPKGVSIVLYCTSRGELASARVAEHLRKRGFTEVWVLEGGLEAWMQEGRPVTVDLKTPQEVAARLGIVLPAEAN